jgi:hypothetical protein
MNDKDHKPEPVDHKMEFGPEIKAEVQAVEDVIISAMEDALIDEDEMDAFDTVLDSLYTKLAKVAGLTEQELALLGVESPDVRKAKKAKRAEKAKSNNGKSDTSKANKKQERK